MIIHLWTGPRSLSTATLYSFAQRNDTLGIDEPLYASWLDKNPNIFRPYREELLAVHKTDGNQVMNDFYAMDDKPIIVCKHIAKQFLGIEKSALYHPRAKHVFLIRNPMEMILGWERKSEVHQEPCSLGTMSLPLMVELFSDIRRVVKQDPIVIDADLLQKYPKMILTLLCNKLDIPFDENMLKWEAGPKDVDGYARESGYSSFFFNFNFLPDSGLLIGTIVSTKLLGLKILVTALNLGYSVRNNWSYIVKHFHFTTF